MCNDGVSRVQEAASQSYSTTAGLIDPPNKALQAAGSDKLRRSVTIYADPDNAGSIYIVSSANATVGAGPKLKAGQALSINTAAAVWIVGDVEGDYYSAITETGSVC